MSDNYNYDKLSVLQESQDIGEYIDGAWKAHEVSEHDDMSDLGSLLNRSTTSHSHSSYTPLKRKDTTGHSSIDTFTAGENSTSGSIGLRRLKDTWTKGVVNRVRRKPLPRHMQGSIRKHPAAEIEPTKVSRGVWKDQLLVDRSLRSMSILMSALAIAMIIVVAANAKAFGTRANKFTSSVGGKTQDCETVTRINTALLFIINVAATMVLGMSNTYQQIVTSLQTSDLKYMLQKFGDSRVGTNSPWNINHKRNGRVKSWAAWLLLVCTSLPVHFLANSLIGPSYIIEPPSVVIPNNSTGDYRYSSSYSSETVSIDGPHSFLCWSAFRTGTASFPHSLLVMDTDLATSNYRLSGGVVYEEIHISYSEDRNCSSLAGTWDKDLAALESTYHIAEGYSRSVSYSEDGCGNDRNVHCTLAGQRPAKCRLNVRMNAAFVLVVALMIKAIYMVTMNFSARGQTKRQLLTFGDVIVASASHSELRVQGECMVNAKESYRRHCSHTCHKHCKSKEGSKTGEEVGHCQKCKKWNSVVRFTNESQPTIATKIKRSLISNLGNTALTQMSIMIFCSIFMVGASVAVAIPLINSMQIIKQFCNSHGPSTSGYCPQSFVDGIAANSGGWGGFNHSVPITSLPPDQLGNEVLSFLISNGAQFIYSLLYLLLIYNITLVSQEYDWGRLEHERRRLRCTTVAGESFDQSYLLQLPKKILFPIMAYSVLTHWMLGEALQTQETIWLDSKPNDDWFVEHSMYTITYAAYPLWVAALLILSMTAGCWWAFGYRREGVIPQMFGSIRVLCAATTCLDDFPVEGIEWGDLGMGKQFRHAGLSSEPVQQIIPNELYAGVGDGREGEHMANLGGGGHLQTAN